jgi:hypothetical protein
VPVFRCCTLRRLRRATSSTRSAGPGFMLGEAALLRSAHRSNSTFKAVGR